MFTGSRQTSWVRLSALGLALVPVLVWSATASPDRLTSQPAPKENPAPKLEVGQTVETQAGQRRRLALPNGGTCFIQEKSRLKLVSASEIQVERGEILLESPARFTVTTPHRTIEGQNAHVVIQMEKQETSLCVLKGRVSVSGLAESVGTGWKLAAGQKTPAPFLGSAQAVDWTKDLRIAAASPLVPASQYAGGALVARDPDGQEAKITLRKFHVDVHIEDGFARTTIDQTYFNHESSQLEGTFYFPLPADASLSRLAMYVDGNLMEGGMAERDYARQVYETIRFANRDPALLEWLDGTTFKMRVFPMEARSEKRIILSYSQKLPAQYGRLEYRFPAGHSLQQVNKWSFAARVQGGGDWEWHSPSHGQLLPSPQGGRGAGGEGASHGFKEKRDADLFLSAAAEKARVDRDVVIQLREGDANAKRDGGARFFSAVHDGHQYLMVRFRPDLVVKDSAPKREPRLWVFLFESSGDRDPLLGRTQIEIIRNLLTHVDTQDQFLVATAGTKVKFGSAKPQAATAENIQAAVEFLENAHLVGALDVAQAFREITKAMPQQGMDSYLVHVGSGVPALGERRTDELLKLLPKSRYVGIGVGRRWNRPFLKAAAERTAGLFTQINPDEPVAWRAFDLASTLHSPRLLNARIDQPQFLLVDTAIPQGEELCAIARFSKNDAGFQSPKSVRISGAWDGKDVTFDVPVKDIKPNADYLPRTWARLEIDRLLAKDAAKHKDEIVALSKAMYVMTPFTSLLVLEHEDLYTQYKVDRGRKDHWALYPAPAKIPVVFEPEEGQPDPKLLKESKKLPAKHVRPTVVVRNAGGESKADKARRQPDVLGMDWNGNGRLGEQILVDVSGSMGLQSLKVDSLKNFEAEARRIEPLLTSSQFQPFSTASNTTGITGGIIGGRRRFVAEFEPVGFGVGITPAQSLTPELGIPLRSSSFDFTVPPSGGFPGAFKFNDAAGIWGMLPPIPRGGTAEVQEEVAALVPEFALQIRSDAKRLLQSTATAQALFGQTEVNEIEFLKGLKGRQSRVSMNDDSYVYRRPEFQIGDRPFFDLLAYCPGMNTSAADILAVLDAEALPSRYSQPGQIDASAKALFEKARKAGWRTWTVPGENGYTVTFDAAGRYVLERELPPGIKERVVCDGETLQHLYSQLFLGAKRTVSRFHRAELASIAPFYVPPAEDLAIGADLKLVGDRVVAIVPHWEKPLQEALAKIKEKPKADAKPLPDGRSSDKDARGSDGEPEVHWYRVHLVFGDDGLLLSRQLVRMPDSKVMAQQFVERDSRVRFLDKDGKETHVVKGQLGAADSNPLPDGRGSDISKNLVLVPLPYRTPEHVKRTLKIEGKNLQDVRLAEALPLLTAYVAAGNTNEAQNVFRGCFHNREQRQLGYYVLLASCGANLDAQNVDVLSEHLSEPLAQYLALHTSPVLRKHAAQWAVQSALWGEGFLRHLANTYALLQRWQSERVLEGPVDKVRAEKDRALDYLKKNKNSAFSWALVCFMQDRAGKKKEFHGEMADAFALFEESPALAYAARYERARCLARAGKTAEARQHFLDIYDKALKDEQLPGIDADFRQALLGKAGEPDAWSKLLSATAAKFIEKKQRPALFALAWQCSTLDDLPSANALIDQAVTGADDKLKNGLQLAAVGFLAKTGQTTAADAALAKLTAQPELADKPGLWRLGVQFADQRDLPSRGLECLEKALETEFQALMAVSPTREQG
ncbi:MAG: FecR domain-containing protein, partial [Gemmataceae bacterium]|nr:FecR domain-containing protein [Gemmataceae bacterium]